LNVTTARYVDAPRSESTVKGVLYMNNIETTDVLLAMYNNTRTTHVTTTSDHNDVAGLEVDEIDNLVLLKIELDGVVRLNGRVRVSDGTAIVGDNVGNAFVADGNLANLEEFVGSLLRGDAVDCETTLDIVK
jgi:hypothetical protein